MFRVLMLIIGGSVGTLCRYILTVTVDQYTGTKFPFGVLLVNLTGCFLIGFFLVLTEEKMWLNDNMRFLLVFGFCAAFTTFSTFIYDSANLIREGEALLAFTNIVISVALGFAFFYLGIRSAEMF